VGSFEDDVVVEPRGGGRYHSRPDHSWDLAAVPQGGIVASLALRAAGREAGDPGQVLRTCTAVFAGAVPPEVPPPLACPSYRDPPPPGVRPAEPLPFWTRVEGRAALGHPPWEQHEPAGSGVATWLRFDRPPRLADGAIDPPGVLTLADRMPGCIAERLGHRGPRWFAPSADLTVHLLGPLRTEWLLAHDHARWAGDGWASADSTLWDQNGTLVAYATQMMLFTYPPDQPK
jgi:hypothetical protein